MKIGREVTWNGYKIYDSSPIDGVHYVVTRISGLRGSAAVEASVGKVVQAPGEWTTTAYPKALVGGLEGRCAAPTQEQREHAEEIIRRAASHSIGPLTMDDASGPITVFIRRDGDLDFSYISPTEFSWSAAVIAPDPTRWRGGQIDGHLDDSYALLLHTGLPNLHGGFVFPAVAPYSWEHSGSSGDLLVSVEDSARFSFRIDGPVVNPTISVEHGGVVRTLSWDISLSGSEYLIVDPHAHTSLLQGQSSRTPWLRQWPQLQRGSNVVRFRALSYSSAALLTLVLRPTL